MNGIEPTVLASLSRALVRFAVSEGHDADALLAQIGLTIPAVDDPEARLPFRLHAALWDQIVRATDDESVGIRLASSTIVDDLSIVGHVARVADDVRHATTHAVTFANVLNERAVARLEPLQGGVRIRHAPSALSGAARAHTECVIGFYVVMMRLWTGRDDVTPSGVFFAHAAPHDRSAHTAFFRAPVVFGASFDGLTIDDDTLAIPLIARDRMVHAFLERRAWSLLDALPNRSILERVERVVVKELAQGAPSVVDVARRLGMSGRTLQRRLADEGLVFGELLERFRKEQSLVLLDDDSRTIEAVAHTLGFSEPKAFRRAFRRWMGLSPSEHRQRRRDQGLSS